MQSSPLVSVIIVTWNSKKYLLDCLERLLVQTFSEFEIILVDNGSEDGALEGLFEKYPSFNLQIHKLNSNLGFATANNVGARLARGKWLVLLNTDAFAEPDWLEKLMAASASHPTATSFSSRQIQANNPTYLDGAGDSYHVSGLAWRRFIGYPAAGYELEEREIFSPCAAAAMYLRSAFWEAGGFDEDFFSYFEDVDLGFRLQLSGGQCVYVPEAVVYHIGSGTFGLKSDFALYHTHRNLVWTFIKDMPATLLWRFLPAHLTANLIYLIYYTFMGRGRIVWKAKWDAMKGLPQAIHKRKAIQKLRRLQPSTLLRLMERGLTQPYTLNRDRKKAIQRMHAQTGKN